MKKLTHDRLHELLSYDSETGIFIWKLKYNKDGKRNSWSGKIAGTLQPTGYIQIAIDRKSYWAHRLAWLYVYGYFPEHGIDHINQVKNDNGIDNLREATQSCNLQNQKINVRNKSGITGVSWNKQDKKWEANIGKNKKDIYLGSFNELLDAAKARYAGELKHHTCVVKSSALEYINTHRE